MSIQSILNQNSVIQKNVTSYTVGGLTSCCITIPWEKASTINRIGITSNQNVTGLTVSIVKDGAKHLAEADAGIKASYIIDQKSGLNIVNGFLEVDFNDVYVESKTGFVHVLISRGSAFPGGTIFNISVEGSKKTTSSLDIQDESDYFKAKGLKIIFNGEDYTDYMIGNSFSAASGSRIVERKLNGGDEIFTDSRWND